MQQAANGNPVAIGVTDDQRLPNQHGELGMADWIPLPVRHDDFEWLEGLACEQFPERFLRPLIRLSTREFRVSHSKSNYSTAADVFDGWRDVLTGSPARAVSHRFVPRFADQPSSSTAILLIVPASCLDFSGQGVVLFEAVRAVPGGGCLDRFRASFAALGAEEAFAFHGGLRAGLFSSPGHVFHVNLIPVARSPARRCSTALL